MRLNFTLERKKKASNVKEYIKEGINIINCIRENYNQNLLIIITPNANSNTD